MSHAVDLWLPEPGTAPATGPCRVESAADSVRVSTAREGSGRLALPAPVNAHDHGYGIRTLDFGCPDDALEVWATGLRLRPETDPYLEALVAFGRLSRGGCGTTVHCHNSLRLDRLEAEAEAVIRAADTCGIRLALSCPVLDDSPFVYGGPAALSPAVTAGDRAWLDSRRPAYPAPAEQLARVEALARRHRGPRVDVQIGPIGPQWCSDAMLEAIAETSARTGLRVHTHLLESPRQRAWLDHRFGAGVLAHLDRVGLLSPRLTVAHGVQLRPDEADLLAERGVRLVSNPSANLRLRSGILSDRCLSRLPCAIGLDGTGFDDGQDIWQEMRLFRLLHNGRDMRPALTPGDVFAAALKVGAEVTGLKTAGDIVVADWARLSRDAIFDDGDPAERLLVRMSADHVTDLDVGGVAVLREGRHVRFDYAAARSELVAQARADLPRLEGLRKDVSRVAGIVARHYG